MWWSMVSKAALRSRSTRTDEELKDTNKNKILYWAKKHEWWTLDRWKCVLWSVVQIGDFLVPTTVSLWDAVCVNGLSAAEEKFIIQIAAQITASQRRSNRHQHDQRRLCESGLHGQIAAKKPLLKDTNNKKILYWAKKHKQWTLNWWKSVL